MTTTLLQLRKKKEKKKKKIFSSFLNQLEMVQAFFFRWEIEKEANYSERGEGRERRGKGKGKGKGFCWSEELSGCDVVFLFIPAPFSGLLM